ncbi:MEMAR_RS02690 family S-layer glycoprotein [Methanorbis rubei]|uniref:PGF-CTERM archaeal protein-sorting signal domain-containing protein n=1 Tax=Methanorbis rubei TaxID=3028300 RepID=A0AAE4MHQ5_9EURY|nr:hypothetical protein [Methanocorpusculaceae archaeon Cs1]
MKIMAVLAVLLAAALFVGAASAGYTVTTYADSLGNVPNQGFLASSVIGNNIYIKVVNDTVPTDTSDVEVSIFQDDGTTPIGVVLTGKVGEILSVEAALASADLETQFVNLTKVGTTPVTDVSTTIEVATTDVATTFLIVGVPDAAVTDKVGTTAQVNLDPVNGTDFGFQVTIIGGTVPYKNQALLTTGLDGTTEFVSATESDGSNMTYFDSRTYPVGSTGKSTYVATLKLVPAGAPGYMYTIVSSNGGMNIVIPDTAIIGDNYNVTITVDADSSFIGKSVTVNFGNGKNVSATLVAGVNSIGPTTYTDAESYDVTITSGGVVIQTGTVVAKDGDRSVNAQTHDSAFVYENVRVMNGTAPVSKLYFFSSDATPTLIATMDAEDSIGTFKLLEASVNGHYGAWYVEANTASNYVTIWYPEISLKAELTTGDYGATSGDSVDGKTINKNTEVSFLIEAPNVGPANIAQVKIVFTTPAAGKTTTFGGANFAGISLSTVQTIALGTGVIAGDNATAGVWTAQAEFSSPKGFADNAKKTNTVSFTLQSTSLVLSAAKDSVVRSNPFTVNIQGDSKKLYFVYLDGASASDVNPTLQPAQSGMKSTVTDTNIPVGRNTVVDATSANIVGSYAYFETDASGKRTVQYNTAANTEDKTYTVKVYAIEEAWTNATATYTATSDYDSVKVKVEKGAVTITASGDGSYYIGDEIKLSGTNTDSSLVYLFLTGQNLLTNGIVVKELPNKTAAYMATSPVAVKTDNTWEFKWDTSNIALDTGAYTIYATSRLTNGKSSDPITYNNVTAVKLSDSEYATISVNLKQPFLSAIPSGTVVAQGDKLYVRGNAEGKPSNLKLFIFGPNYFADHTITVEDDGSYEKKLDIDSSLSSNQYFVVVQHPMYNGVFDAELVKSADESYQYFQIKNTTTGGSQQASFVVWGNNKLQGSQAADALTKMIDDANIDDIYTKLTFTVAAPWIRINNPGDQAVGSKFTVKGTTNLAVGDQILVEVVSSSFTASDKSQTNMNSGVSQTTKVVAGEGADNAWSVDVDTTNWKLDQYTIKVNGIEVDVTTTADFNLVEKVVTPTPTATSAQPTTTTAPATTTATPSTPGFGAFIALAGLGAVALLVLRRN